MSLIDSIIGPAIERDRQIKDRDKCQGSLAQFLRGCWHVIDPGTPLVWGWPMDAICNHLEAVDAGFITRLLITIFPGSTKSTIVNVAFPSWCWIRRPHLRFINASYSEGLMLRDNDRCRRVIKSDWYQARWGNRFQLIAPNRADKFENDHTGWKLATSVRGEMLGQRGDIDILDDPNSPQVESDQVRMGTNRWFNEVVPTRLNNMELSALVVIQQRMHLQDVAGTALAQEYQEWVHLNVPMEYEPRSYVNGFGEDGMIHTTFDNEADAVEPEDVFYQDPRTEENELAWPERFSRALVERLKGTMGPTMASAQLQQRPIPRGGAIIRMDWWQQWPEEPFPPLEFLLCSVDTAYTEKKHNDPSAATFWGVNHDEFGNPRIFMLYAWQEHLALHDLVEKLIDGCQIDNRKVITPRFPVHKLLIEDAASGKSVGQEIARLLGQRCTFGVELINPQMYGDKEARLQSIEHVFASGMVYCHDRAWADKVITQCASVPYTDDDHLADSTAQAIRWLRDCGYAPKREEVQEQYMLERMFRSKPKPLYPV